MDKISPHISLFFDESEAGKENRFKAAINVKSTGGEARLMYWINRRWENSVIIDSLENLKLGFHKLPSAQRRGLDYICGNLLDVEKGTLVEHDLDGEDNDIIDYVSPILDQAIKQKAKIFLFGEPFDDGGGIHDVHMNQGNSEPRFRKSNGVFQDGGIVLSFPDGHWESIFLAFAVQKVHTDDITGHPIGDVDFAELLDAETGGNANENLNKVAISTALVNPVGPDQQTEHEKEYVFLENKSSEDINLDSWSILNTQEQSQKLSGVLKRGRYLKFQVPNTPLSNKGGIITLLDKNGLKVFSISYNTEQARREGNVIFFS